MSAQPQVLKIGPDGLTIWRRDGEAPVHGRIAVPNGATGSSFWRSPTKPGGPGR